MCKDPIVEEIHNIREKILAECDNDLNKVIDKLRPIERKTKHRLVSRKEFDMPRSA